MAKIIIQLVGSHTGFVDPAVRYNFTCTKKYDSGTSHYERLYNHIGMSTASDIGTEILAYKTMFDGDLNGLANPELSCYFTFCVSSSASEAFVDAAIAGSTLPTAYDTVTV